MRWMPADGSSSFECKTITSFCARTGTPSSIIEHITAVCGFTQMDFIVEILCGWPVATVTPDLSAQLQIWQRQLDFTWLCCSIFTFFLKTTFIKLHLQYSYSATLYLLTCFMDTSGLKVQLRVRACSPQWGRLCQLGDSRDGTWRHSTWILMTWKRWPACLCVNCIDRCAASLKRMDLKIRLFSPYSSYWTYSY